MPCPLTKICDALPHQGPHNILLSLLQPLSGEKVPQILSTFPHVHSGLTLGVDDQAVSPTTLGDGLFFKPSKRVRTGSPESVRRGASVKAKERIRARTEEYMRRMNTERDARREARDRAVMEDIIAEMPDEYIRSSGTLFSRRYSCVELTPTL
jgi:hypothetical protein